MQYASLGDSGLRVSRLIVGGSHIGSVLGDAESARLIGAAIDAGITTFYTSPVYGDGQAQAVMGRALRSRREDVVIINKIGHTIAETAIRMTVDMADPSIPRFHAPVSDSEFARQGVKPHTHGLSRNSLIRAMEISLRNLDTDYVDVCSVHYWDPYTPIDETMEVLDSFVRSGKARYIGCSNFAAWHLHFANGVCGKQGLTKLRAFQTEYSLLNRWPEREQLPACDAAGVGVLAFNSLAGNLLTGQLKREELSKSAGTGLGRQMHVDDYATPACFARAKELVRVAEECGRAPGALAQGWVLSRNAVTALLVGPNTPLDLEPMVVALNNPCTPAELQLAEERVAMQPPPLGTSRKPIWELF